MRTVILLLAIVISTRLAFAAHDPIPRAAALQESGDYKGAAAILSDALKAPDLSAAQRKELEFQLDVLRRIKLDYTLTEDDVFGGLSTSIRGLTRDEFKGWLAKGWFDRKTIDGQAWFVGDSVRNLFYTHPELRERRFEGWREVREPRGRLRICRQIKQAARAQHTPYVLPRTFVCTMWAATDENAAPPGQTVRAWLPVPRAYPFQKQIKIIRSAPAIKVLNPESSAIRAAYFEAPAMKNGSAEFSVTYSFDDYGVFFDLDPAKALPLEPGVPVMEYTKEAPHIVFTEKIKRLAESIAVNQTNPMLVAKACYDWVGSNICYSYAREYSTLTNMSDYCLSNRCGDCGQEAFLFMALCRYEKIPARWQSGWNIFPGSRSNHDWCEVYLAPYGWVPVDPWAGMYALHDCGVLAPEERTELHDFYFGGLDYYRMAANSDHNLELDPPKLSPRSDNVDFQRAELEWSGHNIYFDKFSYGLRVQDSE
jgi:transglutaminase-like putative cysteine protease